MPEYTLQTPEEIATSLARRLRELRLLRSWKQTTLASRSGVSLASLRRFEESGQVSLSNLLKLAFALQRLGDFEQVLQLPPAASMAELEQRQTRVSRKRGSK